jgi:hypothetical protein
LIGLVHLQRVVVRLNLANLLVFRLLIGERKKHNLLLRLVSFLFVLENEIESSESSSSVFVTNLIECHDCHGGAVSDVPVEYLPVADVMVHPLNDVPFAQELEENGK